MQRCSPHSTKRWYVHSCVHGLRNLEIAGHRSWSDACLCRLAMSSAGLSCRKGTDWRFNKVGEGPREETLSPTRGETERNLPPYFYKETWCTGGIWKFTLHGEKHLDARERRTWADACRLIVDVCVRLHREQRTGEREMRGKEEMTMWATPSGI